MNYKLAKIITALGVVSAACVGLIDASYLTWSSLTGYLPVCKPPFACDTVLKSSWAQIGPVPTSALGIFFYAAVLILVTLLVLEVPGFSERTKTNLLLGLSIIGLFFSAYFVWLMAFVLRAWCLFCLVSAVNCVVVFLLSLLLRFFDQRLTAREESDALYL